MKGKKLQTELYNVRKSKTKQPYSSERIGISFVGDSISNYEACRCLFINDVVESAPTMASYALEKIMKGSLALSGYAWEYGHDINAMFDDIVNYGLHDIFEFKDSCRLIKDLFEMRYTDMPFDMDEAISYQRDEVFNIDEIYIRIAHDLSVRYSSLNRVSVFYSTFRRGFINQVPHYLLVENTPLIDRLEHWEQYFKNISDTGLSEKQYFLVRSYAEAVRREGLVSKNPILLSPLNRIIQQIKER